MPAILPADNIKYKCLSFLLFPFFLLSVNWEKESIQWQYLGRVEGENDFKVYLSSSTDFFWDFFSFMASRILWSLARRHQLSSCPRLFPLFPGVSATVSIHLVTPTAVLKLGSASSPGVSESDHASSHGDLRPKNWILYPYFLRQKGYYVRL